MECNKFYPWDFKILTALTGYLSPNKVYYLTDKIASTHISPKNLLSLPIILDDIAVLALLIKASFPKSDTDMHKFSSIYLQASLAASLNPEIMLVGWTLFLINSLALFKNSEAKITTDVVPSPTSLSYN